MEQEDNYKYFAFISYNRKDAAFAEELQNYLIHYRLPHKLCKQYPHLPDNVRPIFRDKTGLPIDELDAALREALETSKYLIVICSENAARPNPHGKRWMDREVEYFVAGHAAENKRRIIPIIYRAKGGARATECLLPIIHELGLLAADILDKGKDRTFSDVVAKMLGVNPDVLWNDYERELEAKRRNRRIAGGVLAILAAAGAYGAWDYYCPHTSYYADYVECDNVPVGVNELTEKQTSARHSHYRITKQKHRVARMSHCNSAGKPVRHTRAWEQGRPVTMVFAYNEQGEVAKRTHEDEHGVPEMVLRFHESGQYVNFDAVETNNSVSASSLISTGGRKNKMSEIISFKLERDAAGHVVQEIFGGARTKYASDGNGVWGRGYRLNDKGQVVQVRYLGKEHKNQCTANGVGGYRLEYDTAGEVVKMTYTGADGVSPVGAVMELTRDSATGNITGVCYKDANGAPCLGDDAYARAVYRYDARGNETERAYFGTDGKPCLHRDGYAKVVCKHDARGNETERAYFGVDGKPCLHRDGYAKVVCEHDARGYETERAYFGTDGKLCLCKDAYAKVTYKYDDRGYEAERAYSGTDGKPCLHRDGYAKVVCTRGEQSCVVACYGVDDKLCQLSAGFAKVECSYDSLGNLIKQAYFGADGIPCLNRDGYAAWESTYDGSGNETSTGYFGTDGKPCLCMDGFAKVSYMYDERGNLLEQAYCGADGKPCLCKDAYAKVTYKYDERGNLLEQAYFGVDNQLCRNRFGFARLTQSYDGGGNCDKTTLYDENGQEVAPAGH